MARASKKKSAPKKTARRSTKKSAAAAARSAAAKRAWAARKLREQQLAAKRSAAAKKGWKTRKRNIASNAPVPQHSGPIRLGKANASATLAETVNGRDRGFIQRDLPRTKFPLPPAALAQAVARVMEEARRTWPNAVIFSGGFRYRISQRDDEQGRPVWDEDGQFWQGAFHADFDRAVREAMSAARDFAGGERRRDTSQHYYRFRPTAVVAYVMSERGGFDVLPKKRAAHARKERPARVTPVRRRRS